MEKENTKREKFSSGLAVFFATLGSAVGLGNIWKFPYLTGKSGGGAFLLVYLLCIVFVGLPVMISEFYIGRKTRKNAVSAFEELKPRTPWKYIGFMGILGSYLIMFFYSCVAGWVYSYVYRTLKGDFANVSAESAQALFDSTVAGPMPPIFWQVAVMAVVSAILISGVKKGIEKITKILMPVLFFLILLCDVRALTLPGAGAGLRFLLHVDFSQLTGPAILTALGLAFFKLSLGMGTMVTYGSYFTEDNHMIATSAKVALSDTLVSLLAGIAIFPAVFSFGMEPDAGPGLLFLTIPMVFAKLPLGNILLAAFFILTAIAATTAMISLVEVPVAYFSETKRMSRTKAVVINALLIVFFGVFATLSAAPGSVLGGFTLSGKRIFDLFDYLSSNVLLPVGGLLIALFAGYATRKEELGEELSNGGRVVNRAYVNVYWFIIRYVTPLLLILVFLNSLGVIGV